LPPGTARSASLDRARVVQARQGPCEIVMRVQLGSARRTRTGMVCRGCGQSWRLTFRPFAVDVRKWLPAGEASSGTPERDRVAGGLSHNDESRSGITGSTRTASPALRSIKCFVLLRRADRTTLALRPVPTGKCESTPAPGVGAPMATLGPPGREKRIRKTGRAVDDTRSPNTYSGATR